MTMATGNLILTSSQISKMKHAVGLNNINVISDGMEFPTYRNFFSSRGKDPDWEELVRMGYATCQISGWSQEHTYYLSPEGLRCLGGINNITIIVKS